MAKKLLIKLFYMACFILYINHSTKMSQSKQKMSQSKQTVFMSSTSISKSTSKTKTKNAASKKLCSPSGLCENWLSKYDLLFVENGKMKC